MKSIILASLFVSTFAFAHIEPGVHKGTQADGTGCEMTAGAATFVDGLHHPLNERIEITVNGVNFVVGHPSILDAANDKVGFNHDLFEGIKANASGADAVVIEMVHTQEFEGPRSFKFIQNDWKKKTSSSITCVLN